MGCKVILILFLMPSIFRHNCHTCLTICNILRYTLHILHQKLFSWSFSLESKRWIFGVTVVYCQSCLCYREVFPLQNVSLLHYQTTADDETVPIYQSLQLDPVHCYILKAGLTAIIAVLNFVMISVVISIIVLVVIKRGD